MWSLSICDCECNKVCKIDKFLYINNYSCEKRLIDKLVLKHKDEILNATENSIDDKKVIALKVITLFTLFR